MSRPTIPSPPNGHASSALPNEERLYEWVESRSRPERGEKVFTHFTLSQVVEKETHARAGQDVPPGLGEVERLETCRRVAREFAEAMPEWAAPYRGKGQAFFVGGHLTDDEEETPKDTIPFAVDLGITFDPTTLVQEEGKLALAFGQMQRFADACLTRMAQAHERSADRDAALIARLVGENNQLTTDRWAMTVRQEELADGKALRDAATLKTQVDMQREQLENQLLAAFMQEGFVMLKQYVSSKIANPFLEAMRVLEPDQVLQFIGSLSDSQRDKFTPLLPAMIAGLPEEKKRLLTDLLTAAQAAKAEGK